LSKRTVLIIQARMGSTRLPGKSMMDLAGAPLVGRILERVKRTTALDGIVLAIPDNAENAVLGELGRNMSVDVFEGSEHDCLDRYYQAATASGAELVGRLPADNAAPEPGEIDRIVRFHQSLCGPGFSSNLTQISVDGVATGYPDGIGAEIFDFELLAHAWRNNSDPRQREHVHLNFFDYGTQRPVDPVWCPVHTIACPADFRRPDLVLDVNTPAQYEFMRTLYAELYPANPNFHITDIIAWYDNVYLPRMKRAQPRQHRNLAT
jgi:spore coat polysaccharide biosynthesis protein SpsF (cytidylyltransferase family)